jgi:hypothetical protein
MGKIKQDFGLVKNTSENWLDNVAKIFNHQDIHTLICSRICKKFECGHYYCEFCG